jgi:hypothetical protein
MAPAKKSKSAAKKIPIPQTSVNFPRDNAKVGVVKPASKGRKPPGYGVLGR